MEVFNVWTYNRSTYTCDFLLPSFWNCEVEIFINLLVTFRHLKDNSMFCLFALNRLTERTKSKQLQGLRIHHKWLLGEGRSSVYSTQTIVCVKKQLPLFLWRHLHRMTRYQMRPQHSLHLLEAWEADRTEQNKQNPHIAWLRWKTQKFSC